MRNVLLFMGLSLVFLIACSVSKKEKEALEAELIFSQQISEVTQDLQRRSKQCRELTNRQAFFQKLYLTIKECLQKKHSYPFAFQLHHLGVRL